MLKVLRGSVNGLIAKISLAALAIMFVFWGIGDWWLQRNSQLALKVGDLEYSAQQLQSAISEKIEYLKHERRIPPGSDPQELKSYIVKQLINQGLLSAEVSRLNLLIGDEAVKVEIFNSFPNLVKDQAFDQEQLLNMLKNAGISESVFVARMRDELSRKILLEALSTGQLMNDILLTQISKALTAEREVEVFEVDYTKLETKAPSETDLKNTLESNKEYFSTPEVRSVSYITLAQNDPIFIDNDSVNDSEIQKFYHENSYLFAKPESRSILKMVFKDKKNAEQAYEQLVQGKSFESLAQSLGQSDDAIHPSLVTYDGFEEGTAKAIFDLQKGKFSQPILTPLGWHIFFILDIIPSVSEDIEKIRGEIISNLREHRQYDKYISFIQSLEQQIETGEPITSLTNKHNLKLAKINITKDKKDSALYQKFGEVFYDQFQQSVFQSSKDHVQSIPIGEQAGGHDNMMFFVVNEVQPSELPDFKTIETKVLDLWNKNYLDDLAQNILTESRQKLIDGGSGELSRVIKSKKIKLNLLNQSNEILPEHVRNIFILQLNQCTPLFKGVKNKFMFAKVVSAKEADVKIINQTLNEKVRPSINFREIIVDEYLEFLRHIHEVKIYMPDA